MAHLPSLGNDHSIKKKHRFDLVFAPRLLPTHAQACPGQAAILQLPPRRSINPLDLIPAKPPGQFAAIHSIPFSPPLLVASRYVRRVGYDILDPFVLQFVVNPEPTIPCFIDRPVLSAWKVMSQILAQDFGFRRLAKRFVLPVLSKYSRSNSFCAHPARCKWVDPRNQVCYAYSWQVSFLRLDFVGQQNYSRISETCLRFYQTLFEGAVPVRELSTRGRERRDFSLAPSGSAGRARRAKSRSSRSTLWITRANGLSASPFQS